MSLKWNVNILSFKIYLIFLTVCKLISVQSKYSFGVLKTSNIYSNRCDRTLLNIIRI